MLRRGFLVTAAVLVALALVACNDSDRRESAGSTGAAPSSSGGSSTNAAPAPVSGGSGALPAEGTRRQAAPFDPGSFQLALEEVVGGLDQPLFVTHAGDGSGRLFVVEKGGTIRIISGGAVLPQPFLDIRSLVRANGSEQGLLGMAFHPRFGENGRFFVAYTAQNSDNTVAEFRLSSDPNRADPSTRRQLFAIPDFAANHNGGMLAFGPDGFLYIGTGDGGGAGDPRRNGQNPGALLGKMLRVDVDNGDPFGVPADNPLTGRDGARPEVWAYGLRNPWRYSFDRATGDLWIADVGQNAWEEVNVQPAGSRGGENYGWSIVEGAHCFRPQSGCDTTGITMPVAEYNHDLGCSITGGYVYRGQAVAQWWGVYFYGDYCSGRIWALAQGADGAWQSTELLKTSVQISSFGEDEVGELYLTGINTGRVYRLGAH